MCVAGTKTEETNDLQKPTDTTKHLQRGIKLFAWLMIWVPLLMIFALLTIAAIGMMITGSVPMQVPLGVVGVVLIASAYIFWTERLITRLSRSLIARQGRAVTKLDWIFTLLCSASILAIPRLCNIALSGIGRDPTGLDWTALLPGVVVPTGLLVGLSLLQARAKG